MTDPKLFTHEVESPCQPAIVPKRDDRDEPADRCGAFDFDFDTCPFCDHWEECSASEQSSRIPKQTPGGKG